MCRVCMYVWMHVYQGNLFTAYLQKTVYLDKYMNIRAYIHTYIHACMHAYTLTSSAAFTFFVRFLHTHTWKYVCTFAYMYTYTLTSSTAFTFFVRFGAWLRAITHVACIAPRPVQIKASVYSVCVCVCMCVYIYCMYVYICTHARCMYRASPSSD
jgi:hypothetical protein